MNADRQELGGALGPAGLDRSGSSTWALFRDWCAATERPALPADPSTLAQFLTAHPAAASTQRRRVADIDAVHRRSGLPEPGHAVTIRLAVNGRRRELTAHFRAAATSMIETIPTHGWPHALFGRRDAMILTLVASGMTSTEITVLRRGDITIDGADLVVRGNHRITEDLFGDRSGHGPVAIYRRWAQVQSILDGAVTNRMMADALDPARAGAPRTGDARELIPAARANDPLLVRIDRWGHTPWAPDPLTGRSASILARAHLTGQSPTHRGRITGPGEVPDTADPWFEDDFVLDENYYAHGTLARRRAHQRLSDVGARLDEVENRIEELLRKIDSIDVAPPG
ncbi:MULTISPECIES: recombinase [unclassified Rhodococcus (in: high G+C Gram-positive bacteria)]|uniref:recombinase n=1 Tax=unclassified Rhodococcus (in: high G+C Gram-positive bacteria) TaxID=192944 RepID=UPI001C9AD93F|nr:MULTISPECIES: recombinase [unclassified Rhodococcus (in: high G+C Gram-positive bacteria)]MBY6709138.1 recombinase [Rhodococcus sp. BP-241]